MPEIRQNIATRDWTIIATERAKRPEEFKEEKKDNKEIPPYLENCPFCAGNEAKTPEEVASIKDEVGNWLVKIVPNKFPALSFKGNPERRTEGIYRSMRGIGAHEVIIESPKHNLTTALYSNEQVEKIIKIYKLRYLELEKDPRLAHIIIFKNHGSSAGTSLEHPHSQLVATPVVATHIRDRLRDASEYYDENGECVYCRMILEEAKSRERIVIENKNFICIQPYAAFSPFHTWILPHNHRASFGEISEEEAKDLAGILKETLARLYYGLGNPDYNYCIRSSPINEKDANYFHWYVAIVPRITKPAGFEVGSGMFINTSLPEECAEFLRKVKIT